MDEPFAVIGADPGLPESTARRNPPSVLSLRPPSAMWYRTLGRKLRTDGGWQTAAFQTIVRAPRRCSSRLLFRRLDQAQSHGRHQRLGAVRRAELLVELGDVRLGRRLADVELAGDRGDTEAIG